MEKKQLFIDYRQIRRTLPLDVVIANPYTLVAKKYNAIWDTGATRSVITKKVFDALKLVQEDKIEVAGVNSKKVASVARVDVKLPGGMLFNDCHVAICEIVGNIDMLLGMDIITKGDFLISNFEHTLFSFSVPSQKGVSLRGGGATSS